MRRREWFAFMLAPLLAALAILLFTVVREPSDIKFWGSIFWPLVFFVYPTVLTAGIAYWELCKRKWGVTWIRLCLGGAMMGAVLPALLSLMMLIVDARDNKSDWYIRERIYDALAFVVFGIFVGLTVAVLIRLIAGNPTARRL
jgi:ABC-type Fe3+-siderophore transport system permease subunit